VTLRLLRTAESGVSAVLRQLERAAEGADETVLAQVRAIVDDVRQRGDQALIEYTRRFDGVSLEAGSLRVGAEEWAEAERTAGPEVLDALRYAARRIEAFHERQRQTSWFVHDEHGSLLGVKVTPVERAGLYIPGGSAAYPSTVLMNGLPAKVAGVRERILCSPPDPTGRMNPVVLAAARLAGVTQAFKVGGAQAIAAMAYGTETVPRVDKIVGPGNRYVALAKRLVFGQVGIDMIAGPSEVVVVADETAEPAWIAADLLAQAEHDVLARAICLTPWARVADAVVEEVDRQLRSLPRREIAAKALEGHGAVVVTRDLAEAVEIVNGLAPEHLELMVAEPFALLPEVRHAGAIFLGRHTPEVVGDYVAGPNHVLPTGGTARFSSPLGVEEFVKRSSVIHYSRSGLEAAWPWLRLIAEAERLDAHARAAQRRLERGEYGNPPTAS
jgi:histidinol dehydrogenase